MKLRKQAAIALAVVSVVIFLLLHAVVVTIIMPGFKSVDNQDITEELGEAQSLLNYRIEQLQRSTVDYAWWDDTYDFAQNHDFEFIESNFRDSTFQNLDLNLVIISDIDNNLLYCKIRDNMTASLQADICGEIVSNSLNWNLTGESPVVSGLLLVNGQPMMIAATPILTSEIAGPAVGRLMFGIY